MRNKYTKLTSYIQCRQCKYWIAIIRSCLIYWRPSIIVTPLEGQNKINAALFSCCSHSSSSTWTTSWRKRPWLLFCGECEEWRTDCWPYNSTQKLLLFTRLLNQLDFSIGITGHTTVQHLMSSIRFSQSWHESWGGKSRKTNMTTLKGIRPGKPGCTPVPTVLETLCIYTHYFKEWWVEFHTAYWFTRKEEECTVKCCLHITWPTIYINTINILLSVCLCE